ncbi:hypothetical protein [Halalkalibacter hemicellulosilyticus]|uniref:Uncharacterized protein n=1 Tax=Halalkalibacter hemicellulosilyticusJCM 9152 TaxID=1236971 RepID=W4QD20_9BACI|nr:hypothetical protein [Halalkalibacter hemicellulosilyticus]GAE29920.1 hypothetical protein JCM9152_1307 [Halalkalibacter hemicellulosilyticusJCM 9152]
MEQVMNTLKRKDGRDRIPVLRLEIDYELVTLHDAMATENLDEMKAAKSRLRRLHAELVEYGFFH